MLTRLTARWWLTLICAFPVAFLGLFAAAYVNYNTEPMYVGRTTVMEILGPPVKDQPDYYKMRLANLAKLATSQRVLSNAATTLSDLGMKYSPNEILGSMSVTPIRDTNILAIEVTLPDANEAKVSADVIASECKKDYQRFYAPKSGKSGEMALKTINPAYVRRIDQHQSAKLLAGLVVGLIAGVILGLILAVSIPVKNKESIFGQQS